MINIYNNFYDILHYRDQWNALAKIQGVPLLTFDWFQSCAESFHTNDDLMIICIIKDSKLIAVAPLYTSRINTDYLQVLGVRNLYEPCNLLYKDRQSLKELFNSFRNLPYPIHISRSYNQLNLNEYRSKFCLNGILLKLPATSSQYIEITENFDAFESNLSSKRRSDLRRSFRKAESHGNLEFSIITPDINNIDTLLDNAISIENKGWKKEKGTSIDQNNLMKLFIIAIFKKAAKERNALIGFTLINNEPVACNLSISQYDRLWILKIGYDNMYKNCSPGILLTHEIIRYAHDNNFKHVEFLGCSESWIELWKPKHRNYTSYIYYPLSYKGIVTIIKELLIRLNLKARELLT